MKKIIIKVLACAMLLSLGFVGAKSVHKVSAAELTSTQTVTTLSDPGTGGRGTTP